MATKAAGKRAKKATAKGPAARSKRGTRKRKAGRKLAKWNPAALTQAHLAAVFKVSAAAVAKWDCPRNPDRTYTLSDVITWRMKREVDEALMVMGAESGNTALEEWRRGRVEIQSIELARLRNDLVEVAPVERRWGETVTRFTMAMMALVDSLSPRLESVNVYEARRILDRGIRRALEELRTCPTEAE